jgi:DNA-binding CsgD family transcriptional regulator
VVASNQPSAPECLWGRHLTRGQAVVAEAVAEGISNDEAALRLGLAPQTIKFHLSAVYLRLGLTSRLQLTRWWVEHVEVAEALEHARADRWRPFSDEELRALSAQLGMDDEGPLSDVRREVGNERQRREEAR